MTTTRTYDDIRFKRWGPQFHKAGFTEPMALRMEIRLLMLTSGTTCQYTITTDVFFVWYVWHVTRRVFEH